MSISQEFIHEWGKNAIEVKEACGTILRNMEANTTIVEKYIELHQAKGKTPEVEIPECSAPNNTGWIAFSIWVLYIIALFIGYFVGLSSK